MRFSLISLAVASLAFACSGHPSHVHSPGGGSGSAVGSGSASSSGAGSGSATADNDPALPLWNQVTKGTLPNGLTYYVLHHEKPEQRAYMWLAVNAGSVQEDDDQRGLAHLCEHMAFDGTKNFPKTAIKDYLEKIGMQFGADLNAYTDTDETVYQLKVPTDDPSFLDKGLDILHDWAGSVTYDEKEIERERRVVLEEWRLGRGAGMRIYDKEAPVLYHGTRYADRITIGLPDIIKNATHDVLYRFYKDWYRPDLMSVIVVGDVDPAAIQKQIEAKFGDLVNPEKERPRTVGGVPAADGLHVSIETDKEMVEPEVSIDNVIAHRRESTESDYRRSVRDGLYHTMLDERLGQLQRKSDAAFVWAASSNNDLNREAEAFMRIAGAKAGRVEDTLTTLMTEVVRVERHGFSQAELERAQKKVLRSIQQAALEIDKVDGVVLVQEITRNFFENEEMPGRNNEADMTARLLPTITLDELNKMASDFGGDDNRVVLLAGPATEKMPTEARVKEIIDQVSKSDPGPWVDSDVTDQLMKDKPTPGTVKTETTDAKNGVTTWTLSNGVKVVVKPTDFDADSVLIHGFSPGGTAQASDKQFPSARFAAEVIGAGGVGNYSDTDLEKMLAGKVVNVQPWIGETQEGVSASGSATDLETVMQLVNLTMTAPRKDDQAFAAWKQGTTQWVQNRRSSPEQSFWEDMGRVLDSDAARRRPPEVADVDKVDLDQALAFYQERFGDAGDFTFVIVGNVDLDTLKPMVEQYLGSLPSKGRVEKEKDLKIRPPKGVVKKTITRGVEPKSFVFLTFSGDGKWTRADARDMDTLSRVLEIRLFEVLRQDLGGVYGAYASGGITRVPYQAHSFSIEFGCAPENVAKLEKATFAELARIKKEGVKDDVLAKVIEERKREHETNAKNNQAWVTWLGEAAHFGDSLDDLLDVGATNARTTNKNLEGAAKKFLADKRYVLGVMVPEKKAAAADAPAAK